MEQSGAAQAMLQLLGTRTCSWKLQRSLSSVIPITICSFILNDLHILLHLWTTPPSQQSPFIVLLFDYLILPECLRQLWPLHPLVVIRGSAGCSWIQVPCCLSYPPTSLGAKRLKNNSTPDKWCWGRPSQPTSS